MSKLQSTILCLLLIGTCTLAKAQPPSRESREASIARGHKFALLVCSACHVVATDQPAPPILRTPGSTFDVIANKPETTEASLKIFLSTTHGKIVNPPGMPNPDLADYEMEEVIAYIMSLRREQRP